MPRIIVNGPDGRLEPLPAWRLQAASLEGERYHLSADDVGVAHGEVAHSVAKLGQGRSFAPALPAEAVERVVAVGFASCLSP